MKKVFLLFIIVYIALQSCSANKGYKTAEPVSRVNYGDKKVIGISLSGSAPYFDAMIDYAKLEAARNKAKVLVLDAGWDSKIQAGQISELLSMNIDAICVVPVNSHEIIPSLKEIKEKGIPLIHLNVPNADQADHLIDTYVGASVVEEGILAAESVLKIVGENGGNIVIIEGAEGNYVTIGRTAGLTEYISSNPNIEIIAKSYTKWTKEDAKAEMAKILKAHAKIDVVVTHDDNLAIGCIRAIKALGRAGEFPIVSIGGNAKGYNAIKKGEIFSTVCQPPDWEGITAIQAAVKLMNGEKVKKWLKTPVSLVTRENVRTFKELW